MKELTNKQAEILKYLQINTDATYEKAARDLGYNSRNIVHSHVKALEKKGYIKIIPHHIKILKSI